MVQQGFVVFFELTYAYCSTRSLSIQSFASHWIDRPVTSSYVLHW